MQLLKSERSVSELQERLQYKEGIIDDPQQQTASGHDRKREYREEAASGDEPQQEVVASQGNGTARMDSPKMRWREGKNAPEAMVRGAAVVHRNTAYFRPAGSHKIYSYKNVLGEEQWCLLPINTNCKFGLAIINGLLTSIGGVENGSTLTNALLSLIATESGVRKWSVMFPPMPIYTTSQHSLYYYTPYCDNSRGS